jgi:hypothetical protein
MKSRWNATLLAMTLALSGCAVQQTRSGQLKVGVDVPEMIGQRLATFKLADGSEGVLRVLSGEFSIKLQRHQKVFDIRPAQRVKLLRTEHFGDSTLVVVEKANGNCQHQLEVLKIRGPDVSSWTFGDCRIPLQIERDGDELYFDRVANNRLERIVYREERMYRMHEVALNVPPPAPAPAPATPARAPVSAAVTAPSAATSARPPPPRSAGHSNRGGSPQIADTAVTTPRHVPGLPIANEQFRTALKNEPFMPEVRVAQSSEAPTAARPAAAAPVPRQRSEPAAPPRPRGLSGEVAEDMKPIRIKLD